MKIKIKFSETFHKYKTASDNEFVILEFEKPVSVKSALKKLDFPEDQSKLILVNGIVKNEEQLLQDGDTVSVFPTMSGG